MKIVAATRGALALACPLIVSAETSKEDISKASTLRVVGTETATDTTIGASVVGEVSAQASISVRVPLKWDETAKTRFKELAEKEAFDGLLPNEAGELDALSSLRRDTESLTSPLDYFEERVKTKRIAKLCLALDEYFKR